ncbi:Uncharacterised protein [Serratia fonticola]|uniref:Uncharacterized protein n=1 Tax=Serratia fonticola TaxID=47917 RepID=A0A4U9V5N4_SERFO|nr:Uncharacterised protein [Serratia fonticola]
MMHSDLTQCRVNTDRLLIAPFTAADADDVLPGDHSYANAFYDL